MSKNLFLGLSKTRRQMKAAAVGGDIWQQWRNRLIAADVGLTVTTAIVEEVASKVGTRAPIADDFIAIITQRLRRVEASLATEGQHPCVIVMMGVNGSGKTTTIAKLSRYFLLQDKSILLSASDTFRAAAKEQLEKWALQLGGLDLIGGKGDPGAVAYKAAALGREQKKDIVIVDTAGRLPTQKHLMQELQKICRAIGKAVPGAPHELMLILDATIGQNVLSQMATFSEWVGVTGLTITKMDGSAKGGFLLPLAALMPKPIRFIGVGEGEDDLSRFDVQNYVAGLIGE